MASPSEIADEGAGGTARASSSALSRACSARYASVVMRRAAWSAARRARSLSIARRCNVVSTTTGMRRCIGSARFAIEAHEAPDDDFPVQPAANDGLGRMCRPHWTEYTRELRNASVASKAAEVVEAEPAPEPVAPEAPTSRKGRRAKVAAEPEADAA